MSVQPDIPFAQHLSRLLSFDRSRPVANRAAQIHVLKYL